MNKYPIKWDFWQDTQKRCKYRADLGLYDEVDKEKRKLKFYIYAILVYKYKMSIM